MRAALAVALLVVTAGAARAQEPPAGDEAAEAPPARPIATLRLETQLAVHAPMGFYGVALEWRAWERLRIWGGVGGNRVDQTPAREMALQARVELLQYAETSLELGAGLSYGKRREEMTGAGIDQTLAAGVRIWDPAVRADAELSVRQEVAPRLSVRAFAGAGYTLNRATCTYQAIGDVWYSGDCAQAPVPAQFRSPRMLSPYGGVALAYALRATPDGWGPPPARQWYGYATLAFDAAAALAPLLADHLVEPTTTARREVRWASRDAALLLYLGGAVTVHAVRRRPLAVLASAGARLLLPAIGAVVGFAALDSGYECVGLDCGAARGALAGAVAAALLDGLLIAR